MPYYPPKGEYVAAMKEVFFKTPHQMAEKLREETQMCAPELNITKDDSKALKERRQDRDSYTYSGQRGGHGSTTQTGLHQQGHGPFGR